MPWQQEVAMKLSQIKCRRPLLRQISTTNTAEATIPTRTEGSQLQQFWPNFSVSGYKPSTTSASLHEQIFLSVFGEHVNF